MTDPTLDPDARPDATAATAAPAPPPAPVAPLVASPRSPGSGYGGPRVPAALLLVLAPVLIVVTFAGGVFIERTGVLGSPAGANPTSVPSGGGSADLSLIEEAWTTIQDHYVDPEGLDDEAMAHAAIRAMAEAVGDEGHTEFMTAEEAKAIDQSLSGSFVGIGVQVGDQEDGGGITISNVFPATPAEEAGLQRGDRILAVDGKSTADETLDEAISRVRGPEGESVTLTIGRDGKPGFDVRIVRRKYDLPLASWAMVPGTKTALVRLDQFASGATDEIKASLEAAKAAGATSVILDLRANPGGYVNEAIGVASQFIPSGIVYQSISRDGTSKDNQVLEGGLATDLPLVVLTDGDTASSAEIVTGAIQDARRGTVVGAKTFGTGTVLGRFDLEDGSALRLGVERWLTRNGRPIWHEGLEPDVKVDLPDDVALLIPVELEDLSAAAFEASPDVQVRRAVELLSAGS